MIIILRIIFFISKIIPNLKISEDEFTGRNHIITLRIIDFVVLISIFVLLKIIKNSLEFYNFMMIIFIIRLGLIPYLNYNIDITIIQYTLLFIFGLL